MRQLHVSALLGRVYWADAKDNMIVGKKTDVTENFLGCVLQYFTDPKHGVIHDAEGNEWEVTITQTKNAPAAPRLDPVTINKMVLFNAGIESRTMPAAPAPRRDYYPPKPADVPEPKWEALVKEKDEKPDAPDPFLPSNVSPPGGKTPDEIQQHKTYAVPPAAPKKGDKKQ